MAQRENRKKRRKTADNNDKIGESTTKTSKSLDPALATLFATSLGPIKPSLKRAADPILTTSKARENGDLESSSELSSDNGSILSGHESTEPVSDGNNGGTAPQSSLRYQRKRKHKLGDDDVEGAYMQKLAREEAREDAKSCKRQRLDISSSRYGKSGADRGDEAQSEAESVEKVTGGERGASPVDIPQHESVDASQGDSGVEKASRTVFLGNVSTEAIKSKSGRKAVLEHLASFLPLLPKQDTSHKVDSLRFRSTAFSSSTVPKKVAFARKELMESTTQNTNAYAVYSTQLAAREAAKRLNGTIVLGRHLRVDSVAHPAKVDHRRCVFIGNLGFVDDESETKAAEDEASGKRPRKGKVPADLEEGLWRQFGKAGSIESIRVPRDKTTRVGKGFAYVQFLDPNGVEKALLFDGKKFPPSLPRILRVARAKNIQKTSSRQAPRRLSATTNLSAATLITYRPKIPSRVQSMTGRAGKLLGRAGAAQFHEPATHGNKTLGVSKSPEAIVFEGYRASSKQGKGTLKMGGSGKRQGKPRTRSSRRGAAFKASGRTR